MVTLSRNAVVTLDGISNTWTSTEGGSEYRDIADSLFTNKIGRFYMTDQWKLGYHDYIRDRRTVVDAVWFYQTHTRRLIANQGPAACVWDSLCLKQIGCAVCVKWDTLSSTEFEQIDRTGPMPCDGVEVERLKAEISRLYYESLDKFRLFVEEQAATKCGANTNCSKIVAKTTERTYHYTLYYYDRAGRLVRTVSPKGVDISPSHTRVSADPSHTFVSSFTVDSKGRVLTKTVPDGGTEEYYYDRYGRLRFSVDAVQSSATPKRMTYYKYDRLSRIEETGEAVLGSGETIASVVASKLDNSTTTDPVSNSWPTASDNRARNDVAKYFYDDRASQTASYAPALSRWTAVSSKLTGASQRNVRGRLSWALATPALASGNDIDANSTDVVRSYFSYDAHGNTISSISSVPYSSTSTADAHFLITRTDYEYDLSTGSVVRVDFQPTVPAERFIHRYTYDGSGRLKYVETSRNDVLFDRDAAYDYNRNGTLRRETIGEDSVQGRDYTYTLLGQLKGINHPTLDPTKDPGLDGSSGTNANVAKDAFGMAFHYHTGDFIHTTGTTPSVFADGQAGMLGVATPLGNPAYDLYGGQIGAWTMKTQAVSSTTLLRNGTLVGERFRYDVLGRLREDTTYSHNGTNWVSDGAGGWSAGFRYDQNSNMRKVKRWAMTTATLSQMIDDAVFLLRSTTSNALDEIQDGGTDIGSTYHEETRAQVGAAVNTSYTDAKGRIGSTLIGAIPSATNFDSFDQTVGVTNGMESTLILRNAMGFVVRELVYEDESFVSAWYPIPTSKLTDIAVYTRTSGTEIPSISEWTIHPDKRIGILSASEQLNLAEHIHVREIGQKLYEHSDLVQSVRLIINDVKEPVGGGFESTPLQKTDYDPFGQRRWLATFEAGNSYRYSWQGLRRIDGVGNDRQLQTTFRLFEPNLSTWSSRDPLQRQSRSPYEFVGSNPISVMDPDGKDWVLKRADGEPLTSNEKTLFTEVVERAFNCKVDVRVDDQGRVSVIPIGVPLTDVESKTFALIEKLMDPKEWLEQNLVVDSWQVFFDAYNTTGDKLGIGAIDIGDLYAVLNPTDTDPIIAGESVSGREGTESGPPTPETFALGIIAHILFEQYQRILDGEDNYYRHHNKALDFQEEVTGYQQRGIWMDLDAEVRGKGKSPWNGRFQFRLEHISSRSCGILGPLFHTGKHSTVTMELSEGIINKTSFDAADVSKTKSTEVGD